MRNSFAFKIAALLLVAAMFCGSVYAAATVIGKNSLRTAGYGTATLVAGTVTIADTRTSATTKVLVFYATGALTNSGQLSCTTNTAATSFVVTSTNGADANNIIYILYDDN